MGYIVIGIAYGILGLIAAALVARPPFDERREI